MKGWLQMGMAIVCVAALNTIGFADSHESNYGLAEGLKAEVVMDKLCNPSWVAFAMGGKGMIVCDSGNGQVILSMGEETDKATGFKTEYWKVDADTGAKRYKLGPLAAVFLEKQDTLVVSNAGLGDGEDNLLFFPKPGTADEAEGTNAIPPTTDDEADKGEGNLTGLSLSEDGKTIYVAGQGFDGKTWVLTCDVESKKLTTFLSADEHGIETNSPMQTMPWKNNSLLVLYSGAGGKDDGLIVQWDLATKKPIAQWTVPGLFDPMGMAVIPGTDELAVVDNNWALTEVQHGRLGRVALTDGGGGAKVTILADKLPGPVSCAFGGDKRLYITLLGEEFDTDKGLVIAVSGLTE